MKVLVATLGSAGDVLPFLAIARELARRGHDVEFAASPVFAGRVADAGLPLFPLGTEADYEASVRDPDLFHAKKGLETVIRRGILPALRPIHDWIAGHDPAEAVTVASTLCLGARIAAEHLPHRVLSAHLQPSVLRSAVRPPVLPGLPVPTRAPAWAWRLSWRLVDRIVDRLIGPEANAFRAGFGLPPARGFLGDFVHSPNGVLCLYPDWFAPLPPDASIRPAFTGFVGEPGETGGLPPDLAGWIDGGDRPVVFTPGSANALADDFFVAGARASGLLGRRAVFLTPHAGQLPPDLPSAIRAVAWAPLDALLPHAAALVHHGEIGTSARALAAGIPQVVRPQAFDQPDNAARLERLGVGAGLAPRRFRGRRLARILSRLLEDPAVEQACVAAAKRVDFAGGRTAACDAIEEFAAAPSRGERRLLEERP